MVYSADNLIWIDLEMTGLDTQKDRILEIATVVTDKELEVLGIGPVIAVRQSADILDTMDEWNTAHHGASGLTERARSSVYDESAAERQTLEFLRTLVPAKASPMCGNSICQDRRFLARYMPTLEAYFHYRQVDVSSFKELARRWAPEIAAGFSKESSHQALADVKDSIAELSYYRSHWLGQRV